MGSIDGSTEVTSRSGAAAPGGIVARSRATRSKALGRPLRMLALLAVTLAAWEVATRIVDVPLYILPSPSLVLQEFVEKPEVVLPAFLLTGFEAAAGFALAAVLGVAFAIVISSSRLLEEVLYPYLNIIRVTPIIAIAPVLTIWFGQGVLPMILVAALISFFPIVATTVLGLRSVERDLLSLMRTLNARPADTLWKIRFPSALPHLFAAFRISAPLAVIGAIVGEFVGAAQGMGYLLISARGRLDTPMVFLMVVLSAFLGIAAFAAVVAVERRVIGWHQSQDSV